MARFSLEEKRIYLMVVKRFLACFYPPYEYRRTRAELLAEGERFYAAGRTVLQQGWRKVQDSRDEDEADEQAVPLFHRGDVYTCLLYTSRCV